MTPWIHGLYVRPEAMAPGKPSSFMHGASPLYVSLHVACALAVAGTRTSNSVGARRNLDASFAIVVLMVIVPFHVNDRRNPHGQRRGERSGFEKIRAR